jgi:membrane-anchored mycosin MYCP
VTIKRMLTAAGISEVAATASGAALMACMLAALGAVLAAPAYAAPGDHAQPVQLWHEASTGLQPRAGEWWLTTWKMQPIVWPLTEGAGVTVAVIDTGVQADVPDLRGAVLPGGNATGRHTNGETDLNTDGDGHGTMMAVLIAGQGHGTGMIGMAPEARILPVVVTKGGSDTTSDPGTIAAGITYAANHGVQIIDVSQEHASGSPSGCDPAEQAAVAYALARDVVVVAAAGDTNLTGTGPAEPASCAGVVAVGAVEPNRVLWPGNTHQPYLTAVNPGARLITAGRDGGLVTGVSGTRAASALAAGAIALIRSRYPAMPWYQVVQRVTATALQEGGRVPNDSFGYGIFRLSHAIDATAYPVPAGAANPVYARYRAWLATPQGQAISRQLDGSGSRPARASSHAGGGSAAPVLIAILVPLAGAGIGSAALAARARLGKSPGTRRLSGPGKRRPGMSFPDRERDQEEYLPYPGLQDQAPAAEYLPLGEDTQYRIPPYSLTPESGQSGLAETSLLAPGYHDGRP